MYMTSHEIGELTVLKICPNVALILSCLSRFGGGLIMDIKRKIKCYKSDFVDALNSQCLASVLFIYFACLAPIVTFGGVMENKTDKYMVINFLHFAVRLN
jgi:hypothetical protein